jgi:hypothetical protein
MNNDDLAVQRYPDNAVVFIIINNEVLEVTVSLFNQFQNTYILSFDNQDIPDGNGVPFQFPENIIYPTEGAAQAALDAQLAAAAAEAQELLDATVAGEAGVLNESAISAVGSEGMNQSLISAIGSEVNQSGISAAGESSISPNHVEADFNSDFNNQLGGRRRRRRTIKKKNKKTKKTKKNKKSRRRI